MTDSASATRSFIRVAAVTAILWAAGGVLACRLWSSGTLTLRGNTEWFLGMWALSLFNILALAMTVKEVLALIVENREGSSVSPENRLWRAIRAFSWGTLKLICVGIFIVVLIRAGDVSVMGRLLGAGTLVVVPLVGGLGAVRHA